MIRIVPYVFITVPFAANRDGPCGVLLSSLVAGTAEQDAPVSIRYWRPQSG